MLGYARGHRSNQELEERAPLPQASDPFPVKPWRVIGLSFVAPPGGEPDTGEPDTRAERAPTTV